MSVDTPRTDNGPEQSRDFDWDTISARMEAERAAEREKLKIERVALLLALRDLGIEELEACYDGYADIGNVQGVAVTPKEVQLGDVEARLADFVWALAYNLYPGFEINDGGEGTLTWNVVEDRIDVDHADFYTEHNETLHKASA